MRIIINSLLQDAQEEVRIRTRIMHDFGKGNMKGHAALEDEFGVEDEDEVDGREDGGD